MKRFVAIALLLLGSFSLFAQQWDVEFDCPGANLLQGCKDGEENCLFVGKDNSDAWVMRFHEDGTYESRTYGSAGRSYCLLNVLALPNGKYFATGSSTDIASSTDSVLVMVFDNNLDVLTERLYPLDSGYWAVPYSQMILDDDGSVLAFITQKKELDSKIWDFRGSFWRFDEDGECLAYRLCYSDYPDPENWLHTMMTQQLLKSPKGDRYIVLAGGGKHGNVSSLDHFDNNFHFVYDYNIIVNNWGVMQYYSDHWLNDSVLLLTGSCCCDNPHSNQMNLFVAKVDLEGNILQKVEINKKDTIMYSGYCSNNMAYCNDSTIYFLGNCGPGMYYDPFYPEIYMTNVDLEILGKITFPDEMKKISVAVLPMSDQGCIVLTQRHVLHGGPEHIRVRRFSREDFNPIPCGVSKIPKEQLDALAFPNPAGDEIHLDISELPAGKEHRISISDAMGRTVMSRIIRGEGNVLTIGISGFKSGIYTCQIYNAEKEIVSGKFVKE